MSNCFICNKYIYCYIYICLLHFVVNEDKYYVRLDGHQNMKWEFTLDLNTEGGLELSNRLKQKELVLNFGIDNDYIYGLYNDLNFPSLLKTYPSGEIPLAPGDIEAHPEGIVFALIGQTFEDVQKIGKVINMDGFSYENLLSFAQGYSIDLVLSYEKIELKIAEINKKIINIIFIGLILLIILLIIKLIFK